MIEITNQQAKELLDSINSCIELLDNLAEKLKKKIENENI